MSTVQLPSLLVNTWAGVDRFLLTPEPPGFTKLKPGQFLPKIDDKEEIVIGRWKAAWEEEWQLMQVNAKEYWFWEPQDKEAWSGSQGRMVLGC